MNNDDGGNQDEEIPPAESGAASLQTIIIGSCLASACVIWVAVFFTGWKWLWLIAAIICFLLGYFFRKKKWNLFPYVSPIFSTIATTEKAPVLDLG